MNGNFGLNFRNHKENNEKLDELNPRKRPPGKSYYNRIGVCYVFGHFFLSIFKQNNMNIQNSKERSALQRERQWKYGEAVKNIFDQNLPSTPHTDNVLRSSVKKYGNSHKRKRSMPAVFFPVSPSPSRFLPIPKENTPIKVADNLSRGEKLIHRLRALNSSIAMVCNI
ncbi:MAG: hypothetical protein LBD41_03015 [Clostridiales Family XIII bacterium]|jgi:hypothetical protein|nr:hypothetical protein [Clostridiales Family XIII bacterium]